MFSLKTGYCDWYVASDIDSKHWLSWIKIFIYKNDLKKSLFIFFLRYGGGENPISF